MNKDNIIFVADYIPVGHENAITRRDLKGILHISDRRIRRLIEIARLNGTPIINNGSGYFIARYDDLEDVLQVNDYIASMRNKETAIRADIGALSQWLSNTAMEALNSGK